MEVATPSTNIDNIDASKANILGKGWRKNIAFSMVGSTTNYIFRGEKIWGKFRYTKSLGTTTNLMGKDSEKSKNLFQFLLFLLFGDFFTDSIPIGNASSLNSPPIRVDKSPRFHLDFFFFLQDPEDDDWKQRPRFACPRKANERGIFE